MASHATHVVNLCVEAALLWHEMHKFTTPSHTSLFSLLFFPHRFFTFPTSMEAICACQTNALDPLAAPPTPDPTAECPPGTFHEDQRCTVCPTGTFANLAGMHECTTCPEGTFNPLTGATSCLLCPEGTFNDGKTRQQDSYDELADCLPCPTGTVSVDDRTTCYACLSGTEANTNQTAW